MSGVGSPGDGEGVPALDGDELILVALASGQTAKRAANLAGVSERTVHRRLADPAFRARVQHARNLVVEQALGRLTDGMTAAANKLRILARKASTDAVRVAACKAVIEL